MRPVPDRMRRLAAIASLVTAAATGVVAVATLWSQWEDLLLALACLGEAGEIEQLAHDVIAAGFERRVDLATVNGRVFVNNVSLGPYARIVQSDEYRDDKMGWHEWRDRTLVVESGRPVAAGIDGEAVVLE
jgi:hypothetical protein